MKNPVEGNHVILAGMVCGDFRLPLVIDSHHSFIKTCK